MVFAFIDATEQHTRTLLRRQSISSPFYLLGKGRFGEVLSLVPGRVDRAWDVDVCVDAIEQEFRAECVAQASYRMFRWRVGGVARHAEWETEDGGDERYVGVFGATFEHGLRRCLAVLLE